MAGFPCSVFLALHLTAIIILQGADLNVESKATQDVTMPSSSAAGASAKQESAVYKLRIEMIKAKILAKLQLDRAPVIKEKPKENRITALLSNLNLIGEENDENQANDSEDEYYGKTTKIIVFSEKAKVPPSRSKRNSSAKLTFQFKVEQNSLSSSVPSALLWMHIRKSRQVEINGKFLHIQARGKETYRGNMEAQDVKVAKSKVKKEKKSGSGWIVIDVKDIVQHWFNKTAPYFNATERPVHALEISCQDCETETSHLISSRGRLRPFLVIDLEKPKTLSRKKRNSRVCTSDTTECCRESLYVNFTEIGWDWIIFPKGFRADYCKGTCENQISPFNAYSYMLQEMARSNKGPKFSICCTPSKMSDLSLIHFDSDENIVKNDLPSMRVEGCGCT